MNRVIQETRGLGVMLSVNIDRLLVALTIIGALSLAGWLVGYATVP